MSYLLSNNHEPLRFTAQPSPQTAVGVNAALLSSSIIPFWIPFSLAILKK